MALAVFVLGDGDTGGSALVYAAVGVIVSPP